MKDHKDKWLLIQSGEIIGTRYSFAKALGDAKKLAAKFKTPITIDAIEQVIVSVVTPEGVVRGRSE